MIGVWLQCWLADSRDYDSQVAELKKWLGSGVYNSEESR